MNNLRSQFLRDHHMLFLHNYEIDMLSYTISCSMLPITMQTCGDGFHCFPIGYECYTSKDHLTLFKEDFTVLNSTKITTSIEEK